MIAPTIMKRLVKDAVNNPSKKFRKAFKTEEERIEIAELVDFDLKFHTINIGAPRPGDPVFADEFKNAVVFHRRLQNSGDPVPKNPTEAAEKFYNSKLGGAITNKLINIMFESKYSHVDQAITLSDELKEYSLFDVNSFNYHSSDRYENLFRQQLKIYQKKLVEQDETDDSDLPEEVVATTSETSPTEILQEVTTVIPIEEDVVTETIEKETSPTEILENVTTTIPIEEEVVTEAVQKASFFGGWGPLWDQPPAGLNLPDTNLPDSIDVQMKG